MKKLIFLLLTIALVACSSDKKSEYDSVREQAKKDVIEKLELPEGTKFTDDSMEITTNPQDGEGPNVEYIVKITVKFQDQEGKEITKVHRMHYKKRADAEAAKDRFELESFE
ncbi:hypothetical protein EI546_02320 [Aequorivita sp. H23M31]|uniref:Lipoprotein n=1 Tax=Aequorivita ciconiae TaxID=2494375 RepID=A0A410G065_9FLAO|nr:hypothetical protein [Aequorivita sp. H23M31]QAA80633.1 hypothetical protein EI546_02320 [Aequorivita sp. H23M31]